MDLVDRDRRVERLAPRRDRPSTRRRPRRSWSTSQTIEAVFGPQLGGEAVGVGLLDEVAVVAALDLELVDLARPRSGMKISQMPVGAAVPHRVAAAVPVVEVADHADPLGVRGPDGEVDAPDAVDARGRGRPASRRCGSGCPRRAGGGRSRSGPGRSGRGRRTPRRAPRGSRRPGDRRNGSGRPVKTRSKRPSGWSRSISTARPGSPLGEVDHPGLRAPRAGRPG